jgi:hypothetical protein
MIADVDRLPGRVWRRAMLTGGACAALLVAVYLLAVWTAAGQRFEDAVLKAAELTAGGTAGARATDLLDRLTVPSIAGVVVVVLAVGLVRRKPFLGFLGAGVVLASIATTMAIRMSLLRPVLLHHGTRREDQSFPSGHVAVAMSVMCALVLVAPYRFRGAVVFLTSLWAVSIEVAAVTASWHRPSDTIGSDLIVVFYGSAAIALLARRGWVRAAALPTATGRAARGVLVGAYGGSALLAVTVAAVAGTSGGPVLTAGRAIALSGSTAVALTLLTLLRGIDLDTPPRPADERESAC